jgi:hypothetical protein
LLAPNVKFRMNADDIIRLIAGVTLRNGFARGRR